MLKLKFEKKCIKTQDVFILLTLFFTGSYLLINVALSGEWIEKYSYTSLGGFCDYFFHVGVTSLGENMYHYSADVCFPPLAYCFYWIFMRMAPVQDIVHEGEWFREYSQAPYVMYVFLFYNMLLALLMIYVCYQYIQSMNVRMNFILPILLLLSYPVSYMGIKQGNSAVIVGLILALSLLWIDDENKVKQEIAMILIAVAAGFKIYPALVGIIYIKRRDWKRAFRLLIYGVILFWGPFIFWGGIDGFWAWLQTIGVRAGDTIREYNTIQGYVVTLMNGIGIGNVLPVYTISKVINIVAVMILISCFFLNQKGGWRDALFLLGIITFCIPNNLGYTLVYLIGALLLFLKEETMSPIKSKVRECLFWGNLVGFSLIFSRPVIPMLGKITGGIYTVCYLMLTVNAIWVIYHYIKRIKMGYKNRHEV